LTYLSKKITEDNIRELAYTDHGLIFCIAMQEVETESLGYRHHVSDPNLPLDWSIGIPAVIEAHEQQLTSSTLNAPNARPLKWHD
jgi:hypothetical protein